MGSYCEDGTRKRQLAREAHLHEIGQAAGAMGWISPIGAKWRDIGWAGRP